MGYHGKGIAILTSANGISYTILLLRLLESYNCILPIEVWYVEGDLDQKQLEQIARRGAVPKDLITEIRNNGQFSDFDMRLSKHQRNYQLKSMVLLLSSFQEVLYLDSDNLPARDPSYLFETTLYQDSGAVFWFDIWKTPPDNPIYKVTNLRFENEYEQESGQILLNKEKAWKGLLMAWYFQGRHDFYFSFMLGDKDTFRFGFKLSKTPYKNIGHIPGLIGYYEGDKFCGHSMAQPDHEGKFLFVHATLFKILFDSVEQDKWRHLHYLNQVEAQERLFSVGNSIRYRISYPHPKLFPRLGDNDWGKVCITYELTSEIMRSSEGETKIPNYELREVTLADSELADFETKLFEFSDFKS
ncbi:hypothetical protein MP638_002905 [Amoeboaphelidium occidentale]|nr:hypothetical protein MP638_002905 [Amoeboaphelidium occidentale]